VLDVHEDHVAWEGMPVFRQAEKGEGLPWQLYKDGLRQLVLRPGVETREIFDLLGTINHARMLPADSTDDLLTLMWEQEFSLIEYAFVEVSGDGAEFHMERSRDIPAAEATAADTRAEAAAGRPGVVDLADFDATLYFLDDAEVRYVQAGLDEEYRRDIREAAIDALLDILETQRAPAVREEVVGLLEEILPAQLATGGFRVAARILRELRIIASRAPDLDPALRDAVLSFEERLSTPDILLQLFRVLEESATHAPEEDVGEVLRELRPQALPVVLAQLARITSPSARRTLESSVEAIARTRPEALAALIDGGPGEALAPAIALAARLGLTSVVPAIVKHLGSPDVALRLIVVRALADLGTPTAITAIEGALSDAERSVRQAALNALMARGGSGGLLGHLERLLFGSDDAQRERSERRALFEAYGTVAGPAAIPRLRELFEPRGRSHQGFELRCGRRTCHL